MKSDWEVVSLSQGPIEIIDGDRGANYPKQSDFSDRGHCLFLNASNVSRHGFDFSSRAFVSQQKDNELRKGKMTRDDLVITTRGTLGNVAYFDEKVPFENMRINSGMVILRPNLKKIEPRYLYLFLRSNAFLAQVDELRSGSAQPQLPIRDMSRILMPLPPLAEQRSISEILGTLDDKIELNRRMNETLEAMARSLFKSWFVGFDPVHAKAAGRQPAGMDAATAALFPSEFQDSVLGPIPKGWEVSTIGEVSSEYRRTIQPAEVPPATPYIGLEHMPQRSISLSKWGHASNAQSQKSQFRQGDILFGKLRPYFHKVGVAPVDGLCSTDIVVIEPISSSWFGFVLCHASSDAFVAFTNAGSDGTRMPRTSWSRMSAYSLVRPSENIAAAFTSAISSLIARIAANNFEAGALTETRDLLLPGLLSGEVSVRGLI